MLSNLGGPSAKGDTPKTYRSIINTLTLSTKANVHNSKLIVETSCLSMDRCGRINVTSAFKSVHDLSAAMGDR